MNTEVSKTLQIDYCSPFCSHLGLIFCLGLQWYKKSKSIMVWFPNPKAAFNSASISVQLYCKILCLDAVNNSCNAIKVFVLLHREGERSSASIIWVWFSAVIVKMSRVERRDIIAEHAIRFKPMHELKMDDFPEGCTNPLKCHGTLSWASLNKSHFHPGIRSHHLHLVLLPPEIFELALWFLETS